MISMLYKLFWSLLTIFLLLLGVYFLQTNHYITPVPQLVSELKTKLFTGIKSIHSFEALSEVETDKTVQLALVLPPDSTQRALYALKHHLDSVLSIQEHNGKTTKYILQIPENGSRYFSLDQANNELKGKFKTFTHISDNGVKITKLVPINPEWIKK